MLTVNLTTTFERLSLCKIALISLLLQSKLPDRINLWVSREPYLKDQGMGDGSILEQVINTLPLPQKSIIRIRWTKNIGPYRKLIPILRESDLHDLIVTADDDIFYGENWLSMLIENHHENECTFVAPRVRLEKTNFFGKRTSYIYWRLVKLDSILSKNYVATFGGGSVLTKRMFREEDILDDSFIKLSPSSDDLWYSRLLQANSIKVRVAPKIMSELNFIEHTSGLFFQNTPQSTSGFDRLKYFFWDVLVGYLGFSVCENDASNARIRKYLDFQ